MKIGISGGGMSVVDFNEFDAYRIALAVESRGIEFYRKAAGVCAGAELKEAFGFLADEEIRHSAFFDQELTRLRQQKADTDEEDDLLTSMDYGIFSLPKEAEGCSFKDGREIIALGITAEERSIMFYELCRQRVSSKDSKKALGQIIEEEKKHKALLEKIKASR